MATIQKRKADDALDADHPDQSPSKRTRAESVTNTATVQDATSHSEKDHPKGDKRRPTIHARPSSNSRAARSTDNEATRSTTILPQSWDQASTADMMLVDMKDNTKAVWSRIEQRWEQLTGEKPAKGMLRDRYQHLKDLKANSNDTNGEAADVQAIEEPVETSNRTSKSPDIEVRSTSPAVGRPSDESSLSIAEDLATSSEPLKNAKAAPVGEVDPEQHLPQSWEQANAGDQLIVRMKTTRKAWSKIEEAWEQLTGRQPADGALQDRYRRIKDLIMCPKISRADKHMDPVNDSNVDGGSDQASLPPKKPMDRTLRMRKAEVEALKASLDKSVDESVDETLHDSTHQSPKQSPRLTRDKSRGAVEQHATASSLDESSDGPPAKRTKIAAAKLREESVEAGPSDELNENPKFSPAVAKSVKGPRGKGGVAATSHAQNEADTADEMLVEMRESGSTWKVISKAWKERTGLAYVPETLRQRYARIKSGSAPKLPPVASVPQKRKAKAGSPDDVPNESSRKRTKSTLEIPRVADTPVKRNMDRGKRKSSVKYTDSTTDEDELAAEPIKPAAKALAPTRRVAGRSAKVDRSDPEWLVTDEKSPLAHEDLHAEFSNPKTYEQFTKSDWEDLRETLPPNVPVNPDGYSIPMTFFKYDPDFRRGIREFQEDLGSGRLDPKWQADAAQAMEERVQGKFDAYKEDQFEAFWGQKQKLNHDALAGESTKIKLELLIQNEIFRVGDYFSYSRVVGRGKNGVLIEKDCKIVSLDDKALTFAIPPGQRKFSRHMFESATQGDTKAKAKAAMTNGDEGPISNVDAKPNIVKLTADVKTNGGEAPEVSGNRDEAMIGEEMPDNGNLPRGSQTEDARFAMSNGTNEVEPVDAAEAENVTMEANISPPAHEEPQSTASEGKPNGMPGLMNDAQSLTPGPPEEDEDIIHSISNLTHLEHKIVDIDGRFNSKDLSIQNTWKNFRGIRNHQDLGSLFEMREDFFVYKHPQIVKEPKRKR